MLIWIKLDTDREKLLKLITFLKYSVSNDNRLNIKQKETMFIFVNRYGLEYFRV